MKTPSMIHCGYDLLEKFLSSCCGRMPRMLLSSFSLPSLFDDGVIVGNPLEGNFFGVLGVSICLKSCSFFSSSLRAFVALSRMHLALSSCTLAFLAGSLATCSAL